MLAENNCKKHGNPCDYLIYKDLCNAATTLANTKKLSYFRNIVNKSNNNPKTLFRLVNKALDRKQSNDYWTGQKV